MLHLTLNVPLELRNPPQAMQLTRKPPSRIEVRFAAHRDLISSLEPRTVRAVVDLTDVKSSNVSITLTPEHIVRPEGILVLNIKPSQLILDFVSSKHSKDSRKSGARR